MRAEEALLRAGYGHPQFIRRRQILRETLSAFSSANPSDRFHTLAAENLSRWREQAPRPGATAEIRVLPGDWGEVASAMTKAYGTTFAVLNMANAHVPGGGYIEGSPAQEENMFRRTDCHFRIGASEYDQEIDRYLPRVTSLLSAEHGAVLLDTKHPRVCIRGAEDRTRDDLGYPWLADEDVFSFFELRASAQDLRGGLAFDGEEARRRIAAQLDTLRDAGVRHAVLGAFGCGAFENPALEVARMYKEEILARQTDFAVLAFAIFAPGYGPDNFTPFAKTLGID